MNRTPEGGDEEEPPAADRGGDSSGAEENGSREGGEVPDPVLEEAERLTRLAHRAVDSDEADAYRRRRARLLSEHGYTARVRDDERRTLVCHPEEWVDDGVVDPGRIEDLDRAAEVPLDGPGDPESWETVHERNLELARRVREQHGESHGANAEALATFASNHYAKPVGSLTPGELEEFRSDYFRRNVWPTDEQRRVLEESIELVLELSERS